MKSQKAGALWPISTKFLLSLTVILSVLPLVTEGRSISVMTYNLENLFDTVDDPRTRDEEFTPDGHAQWTKQKLAKKMNNLAEVVKSVQNPDGSRCPDILGVVEVENPEVTKEWKDSYLRECHYNKIVVDRHSPDPRGIRPAILSRLDFSGASYTHDTYPGGRTIIESWFQVNGYPIVVFANHWKSRIARGADKDGGVKKRKAAAMIVKNRIEEILQDEPSADIVILGDLNDEPENASIKSTLGVSTDLNNIDDSDYFLWSSSYDLFDQPEFADLAKKGRSHRNAAFKKARGSYYYRSKKSFFQLDHIILSKGLFDDNGFTFEKGSFEVVGLDRFKDEIGAPLPFEPKNERDSYGASDHFPLLVRLSVDD